MRRKCRSLIKFVFKNILVKTFNAAFYDRLKLSKEIIEELQSHLLLDHNYQNQFSGEEEKIFFIFNCFSSAAETKILPKYLRPQIAQSMKPHATNLRMKFFENNTKNHRRITGIGANIQIMRLSFSFFSRIASFLPNSCMVYTKANPLT